MKQNVTEMDLDWTSRHLLSHGW